jgi:hypothetical protein
MTVSREDGTSHERMAVSYERMRMDISHERMAVYKKTFKQNAHVDATMAFRIIQWFI